MGIFDAKNNKYTSGFYIDTEDALINIRSPKFYVGVKKIQGSRILTIFSFDGVIRFNSKNLDRTYQITTGKYVEIYNGDKIQPPADYQNSPYLSKLFTE